MLPIGAARLIVKANLMGMVYRTLSASRVGGLNALACATEGLPSSRCHVQLLHVADEAWLTAVVAYAASLINADHNHGS